MSYEDVVELAQRDEGILGLILTGSHGLGDVLDGWEPDLDWLRGG